MRGFFDATLVVFRRPVCNPTGVVFVASRAHRVAPSRKQPKPRRVRGQQHERTAAMAALGRTSPRTTSRRLRHFAAAAGGQYSGRSPAAIVRSLWPGTRSHRASVILLPFARPLISPRALRLSAAGLATHPPHPRVPLQIGADAVLVLLDRRGHRLAAAHGPMPHTKHIGARSLARHPRQCRRISN